MTEQDVKVYLQGIIQRDVSYGQPIPPDDPWWATPEGKKSKAEAASRAEARASGDIRMVMLSEPGSIKWIEVTRAGLRRLRQEGWRFDEATTMWSEEP